jgi:hypothetical protein
MNSLSPRSILIEFNQISIRVTQKCNQLVTFPKWLLLDADTTLSHLAHGALDILNLERDMEAIIVEALKRLFIAQFNTRRLPCWRDLDDHCTKWKVISNDLLEQQFAAIKVQGPLQVFDVDLYVEEGFYRHWTLRVPALLGPLFPLELTIKMSVNLNPRAMPA